MSTRRAVPAVLASVFALLFFGLGNYLGARHSSDSDEQFAALRAEIAQLKRRANEVAARNEFIESRRNSSPILLICSVHHFW